MRLSLTTYRSEASVTREVIADLSFSAVSCSFLKLLSQLAGKLRRLQRALSFYGEVLAVRGDDAIRFGDGTHFPQSHPHACKAIIVLSDGKTSVTVYRIKRWLHYDYSACVFSLSYHELR